MTTTARRQQLIIYLADIPDKKINALYTLLEDDMKGNSFSLTDEHLAILEERRNNRLSGKSKPQSWKEVHEKIRSKRKSA